MKCDACAQPLPDGAKFCHYCGNAVDVPAFVSTIDGERPNTGLIRCPDCGHAVSDDAFLCPSCGKVIGRPALQRALAEKQAEKQKEEARRRSQELRARSEKEERELARVGTYLLFVPVFVLIAIWLIYRVITWRVTCSDFVVFAVVWLLMFAVTAWTGERAKERVRRRQLAEKTACETPLAP